jgi:hypothetical protein
VFVGLGYNETITVTGAANFEFLDLESGAVSLGVDAEADVFHLQGGDLLQATAADMTVTDTFEWTDGDINVAGNAANLTITGATGTIAPVDAGTVILGSSLEVVNEAFVVVHDGTLDLQGGVGIMIENAAVEIHCKYKDVRVERNPNVEVGIERITIGEGGKYTVTRTNPPNAGFHSTNLPIEINGGLLQVGETVHVEANGKDPVTGRSVSQFTGETNLYYGSRLVVPNGFDMSGGSLYGKFGGPGEKVTIEGNFSVYEGLVAMSVDGPGHVFGTIRVEGNVSWSAGTYRPYIDGADQMKRDLWESTGTFTITAPALLDFRVLNVWSAKQDWNWKVLASDTKIVYKPNLAGSPLYDLVDDGNNPVKVLFLKRV